MIRLLLMVSTLRKLWKLLVVPMWKYVAACPAVAEKYVAEITAAAVIKCVYR